LTLIGIEKPNRGFMRLWSRRGRKGFASLAPNGLLLLGKMVGAGREGLAKRK
jgi:hypothetical protein